MKNLIKISTLFIFILGFVVSFNASSVFAAKELVSETYSIGSEYRKFPIKLPNGLTIQALKYPSYIELPDKEIELNNNGSGYIPAVFKGQKLIIALLNTEVDGNIQFTVTKDNDTFIYYKDFGNGMNELNLVGIHPNGEVFLNKHFAGVGEITYLGSFFSGPHIYSEFHSADVIEIGMERYSYDDIEFEEKHSEIYNSVFYSLSKDGKMKVIDYIDKDFANLAKKGQLKWVPGSLGMTLESLRKKAEGDFESVKFAEFLSKTSSYLFSSVNINDINKNSKVNAIYRKNPISGSEKELTQKMQTHFGNPVAKNKTKDGYAYMYKAGEYYVVIQGKDGVANFYIGTKYGINAFSKKTGVSIK